MTAVTLKLQFNSCLFRPIIHLVKSLMEFNRWAPKMCTINSVSHQMWNIVTIPPSVHELQHWIISRKMSLQNDVNLIFALDIKIHHFIIFSCWEFEWNLNIWIHDFWPKICFIRSRRPSPLIIKIWLFPPSPGECLGHFFSDISS